MTSACNEPALRVLAMALGLGLWLGACGPSADELRMQRAARELRVELAEQRQHNEDLALRLRLAEARSRVLIGLLEGLTDSSAPSLSPAQASLQGLDADLNELVKSVRHSQADRAAMQAQRAALEAELTAAKGTLQALEGQQARDQARAATFAAVIEKLAGLISDERLSARVVDNRMLLALPDDLLFASNDARVSRDGLALLDRVADVLMAVPDRDFQVAGHSDARPVRYGRYTDNWRLSAERALNVMHRLVERGVPRGRVSAVAYADTRPVDAAQTDAAARRNRRIEIMLMPKLDELPDLSKLETLAP